MPTSSLQQGPFALDAAGPWLRRYNPLTGETINVQSPIWYKEDFVKTGTTATAATILDFTPLDTSASGNTTPLFVDDALGGALRCPLDATNEVQLSGIYHGDNSQLCVNKGVNIEIGVTITSAAMTDVSFYFGLCDAHNATFASVNSYICAYLSTSFALGSINSANGAASVSNTALATLVTATKYVLRWDLTTPAVPKLFLNGTALTLTTAHDMSGLTNAQGKMQPYVRVGKASGTTLALVDLDWICWWQDR